MARDHNRDLLTPWWRSVLFVALVSLVVALANTYVVVRERPFLEEWRSAVVIAAVILVATVLINAVLDRRDRAGDRREPPSLT